MSNLTLAIEDELLQRARVRAVREGTSVNAVVRDYLVHYADTQSVPDAMRHFRELAEQGAGGTPGGRRRWTRDELYDDRGRR